MLNPRRIRLNQVQRAIGENLSRCHRCSRRQPGCHGPCACRVDGVDISRHARAGSCPLGKHRPAEISGWGDLLAVATHWMGIDRLANRLSQRSGRACGCRRRRGWLNRQFPIGRVRSAGKR